MFAKIYFDMGINYAFTCLSKKRRMKMFEILYIKYMEIVKR